jgi:hypothetical protein
MEMNVIYFKKPAHSRKWLGLSKFETGFHYIAQAGLELVILLLQTQSGLEYRHPPPNLLDHERVSNQYIQTEKLYKWKLRNEQKNAVNVNFRHL